MPKLIESTKAGDKKRGTAPHKRIDIFQHNGWALCEDHKPVAFDLVKIKDKNNRAQHGWWTGQIWDFGSQRIGEPLYWQRVDTYLV